MQLNNKKGFTVVELMISITVFTVAILLVTSAVIYIGKQYQKGVSQAQLQDAARTIHQNITDAIKFSGADATNITIKSSSLSSEFNYYCIGNAQYFVPKAVNNGITDKNSYNLAPFNLYYKLNSASCKDYKLIDLDKLLPDNAKVTLFSIIDVNGVWEIKTNFIIADEDLAEIPSSGSLDQGVVKCKTNVAGREFCAQTNITSYASKRTN